jgi:uncharacterized membrane protein YhhN
MLYAPCRSSVSSPAAEAAVPVALPPVPVTALCALAVLILLAAERAGLRWLIAVAKLTASTCFVAGAVLLDGPASAYGSAILTGLVLSWIGDACLLSSRTGPFLAGLGSFLLAHIAYVVAFVMLGLDLRVSAGAAVVLIVPAVLVWRWLAPHLDRPMRGPVMAYMVAITAMLATGLGAGLATERLLLPAGALAFYLSDLSVARDRFVQEGFSNRLWGLPLYFGAQLVLAASVASQT